MEEPLIHAGNRAVFRVGAIKKSMGDLSGMQEIILKPIGFVSSEVSERRDENWGQTRSRIILKPEFAGGLKGLEDFSHALIVCYLHEAAFETEKHLRRRPRNLAAMPRVGIFSLVMTRIHGFEPAKFRWGWGRVARDRTQDTYRGGLMRMDDSDAPVK